MRLAAVASSSQHALRRAWHDQIVCLAGTHAAEPEHPGIMIATSIRARVWWKVQEGLWPCSRTGKFLAPGLRRTGPESVKSNETFMVS